MTIFKDKNTDRGIQEILEALWEQTRLLKQIRDLLAVPRLHSAKILFGSMKKQKGERNVETSSR